MSTTDNACFEITCPSCGQKTEKSLAWLKEDGNFTCPACGTSVQFDGPALLNEMQPDLSEGIAKLRRQIAEINQLLKR